MHETRFINEIFAVLKQKLDEGALSGQIIINTRLSPFSHVSAQNLRQSFKALSKGRNFTNVRLKVFPAEIMLECKSCKRSSRITQRIFGCPICGSADVEIRTDKEFFVETIEIKQENKATASP